MKAMILAAGRGHRLRPITDTTPKPLVKVRGQPLIESHLLALSKAGINDIVINVSYRASEILQALGDGRHYGVNIHYSLEETAMETGGGIKKALPLLGDEPFILVNSDVWTDYDFTTLVNKPLTSLAHLVMVNNPKDHPAGDFALEAGFITDSLEHKLTYSGIALLHPLLFSDCKEEIFRLASILRVAISQKRVTGEYYAKQWFDIGTVEKLNAINHCIEINN